MKDFRVEFWVSLDLDFVLYKKNHEINNNINTHIIIAQITGSLDDAPATGRLQIFFNILLFSILWVVFKNVVLETFKQIYGNIINTFP